MKVKIRSLITAPPGHSLVALDFSQAESWIVAHLAKDPNMIHHLTHGDIHRETAARALFSVDPKDVTPTMRYAAKQCNHAFAYRMGPERATQVINKYSDKPPYLVVSTKETKEFQRKWLQYYRGIQNWWLEIDECAARSRTITTTYGRKRFFAGQYGPELFKEMTAYEPQSTVADHCNGRVHPKLGARGGVNGVYIRFVKTGIANIINQSHDSIIVECRKQDAFGIAHGLVEEMRRPLIVKEQEFTIPVDVEVGERWGELEKINVS